MAKPHVDIVYPGVITSLAREDFAEGDLQEVLQALGRLSEASDQPGLLAGTISGLIQALGVWLRVLKSGSDLLLERNEQSSQERQRLVEEIAELRRREQLDPHAGPARLRLLESMHRLDEEGFKAEEGLRREQLTAKQQIMESYAELVKQLGRLDQLGIAHPPLPPLAKLFEFLDAPRPRMVLIAHAAEVLESALPPRIP